MSKQSLNICDIEGCENLARHSMDIFVHGEQKGENSFGAHLFPGIVEMCGGHEYQYRKSLPQMELKQKLSEKEYEMTRPINPYGDEQ